MQWHREGFLMRVLLLFYISGVILKGLLGLCGYTAPYCEEGAGQLQLCSQVA